MIASTQGLESNITCPLLRLRALLSPNILTLAFSPWLQNDSKHLVCEV